MRYFDLNHDEKIGLISFISLEAGDSETISNALIQQLTFNEYYLQKILLHIEKITSTLIFAQKLRFYNIKKNNESMVAICTLCITL